jgi:hypothetical protein
LFAADLNADVGWAEAVGRMKMSSLPSKFVVLMPTMYDIRGMPLVRLSEEARKAHLSYYKSERLRDAERRG